jgi:hypothetical protein
VEANAQDVLLRAEAATLRTDWGEDAEPSAALAGLIAAHPNGERARARIEWLRLWEAHPYHLGPSAAEVTEWLADLRRFAQRHPDTAFARVAEQAHREVELTRAFYEALPHRRPKLEPPPAPPK